MLTEKQRIALDALLAGSTGVEAAKKAGVSEQLVSRWRKKNTDFVTALGAYHQSILDQITTGLLPLLPDAQKAVKLCLTTGNGTVRMRAAALVYEQLERCAEREGIVNEVEALRSQLEELKRERDDEEDLGPPQGRDRLALTSQDSHADCDSVDDLGQDAPRSVAS